MEKNIYLQSNLQNQFQQKVNILEIISTNHIKSQISVYISLLNVFMKETRY